MPYLNFDSGLNRHRQFDRGRTTLCLTYLSYFFIFEMLWSRTPGKFMQGLVVRNIDGTRSSLKSHLIRTISRVLEANPILFGGIPAGIAIFASAKKQRIGDSLAGTVVVSRRDVAS
ncbi:MAG TPA: RDD family protein [Pyrinomonadaceae bacterium]|nr:RDD family protein [Pyrinomonadaceae bacterium]